MEMKGAVIDAFSTLNRRRRNEAVKDDDCWLCHQKIEMNINKIAEVDKPTPKKNEAFVETDIVYNEAYSCEVTTRVPVVEILCEENKFIDKLQAELKILPAFTEKNILEISYQNNDSLKNTSKGDTFSDVKNTTTHNSIENPFNNFAADSELQEDFIAKHFLKVLATKKLHSELKAYFNNKMRLSVETEQSPDYCVSENKSKTKNSSALKKDQGFQTDFLETESMPLKLSKNEVFYSPDSTQNYTFPLQCGEIGKAVTRSPYIQENEHQITTVADKNIYSNRSFNISTPSPLSEIFSDSELFCSKNRDINRQMEVNYNIDRSKSRRKPASTEALSLEDFPKINANKNTQNAIFILGQAYRQTTSQTETGQHTSTNQKLDLYKSVIKDMRIRVEVLLNEKKECEHNFILQNETLNAKIKENLKQIEHLNIINKRLEENKRRVEEVSEMQNAEIENLLEAHKACRNDVAALQDQRNQLLEVSNLLHARLRGFISKDAEGESRHENYEFDNFSDTHYFNGSSYDHKTLQSTKPTLQNVCPATLKNSAWSEVIWKRLRISGRSIDGNVLNDPFQTATNKTMNTTPGQLASSIRLRQLSAKKHRQHQVKMNACFYLNKKSNKIAGKSQD